MPQVGDAQLTERAIIAVQRDLAIQDAWRLIDAGNALELNPPPGRYWGSRDFFDELLRPSPQRDELDPHLVQLVEIGVGRQLGVEDEFFGKVAGPLLPVGDEAKDLIVLLALAQIGVGVAENPGISVLGQESQDSFLLPAPLGDIVLLNQRVLTVEGDRVKVEVERRPPSQPQTADRIEPATHQRRVATGLDATTIFGEE